MADSKDDRPRGSGQRVVENPQHVGRAGTQPGVQGRPVPHGAPGDTTDEETRRREALKAGEAEQEEARRQTSGETARAAAKEESKKPPTDAQKKARDKELRDVPKELRDKDTSGIEGNESTPSQQPTNLESKGGTTQPHPTVSARAGVGGWLEPPPGRSHNRRAAGQALLEAGSGKSGEGTLMVRATRTGYYNHARRREGDIFALIPREGKLTEYLYDKKTGEQLLDKNDVPRTRVVDGVLSAEDQFSSRWMEVVNADEAERVSTSQQNLDKEHSRIIGERGAADRRGASGRFNDQNVVG